MEADAWFTIDGKSNIGKTVNGITVVGKPMQINTILIKYQSINLDDQR